GFKVTENLIVDNVVKQCVRRVAVNFCIWAEPASTVAIAMIFQFHESHVPCKQPAHGLKVNSGVKKIVRKQIGKRRFNQNLGEFLSSVKERHSSTLCCRRRLCNGAK